MRRDISAPLDMMNDIRGPVLPWSHGFVLFVLLAQVLRDETGTASCQESDDFRARQLLSTRVQVSVKSHQGHFAVIEGGFSVFQLEYFTAAFQ